MKFDCLFFKGNFLVAKPTGWQWGSGEDGRNGDTRFELIRGVEFPLIGSEKLVNGKILKRTEQNEIEVA